MSMGGPQYALMSAVFLEARRGRQIHWNYRQLSTSCRSRVHTLNY